MSKRIAIYTNGDVAVIDTKSKTKILLGGGEPVEYVEYNPENMAKYFPNVTPIDKVE